MALTDSTKNAVIIALADPKSSTELIELIETNASDTSWSDPIDADLLPDGPGRKIGAPTNKFDASYTKKIFACNGSGSISMTNTGAVLGGADATSSIANNAGQIGNVVIGYAFDNASLETSGAFGGNLVAGVATQGNSKLAASQSGASAQGFAKDGGKIYSNAAGASAKGYAYGAFDAYGTSGDIRSTGKGAFAQGAVFSYYNNTLISAESTGASAFGYAKSTYDGTAEIKATGTGSSARGRVDGGLIETTSGGQGASAEGRASSGATIRASGFGSKASGAAAGGGNATIEATQSGSHAFGNATSGNPVRASGTGSMAVGSSAGGAIEASASNSAQFGPGTNAQVDSVQVGSGGLRFKGTTGAPGALQNGDMWVNNNYVYIRSNDASVKL